MDTPELDDAINVLKILKSRGNGELTERGERRLLEYETIKKQLALFSVVGQSEQYCEPYCDNRYALNDGFSHCPDCGKELG